MADESRQETFSADEKKAMKEAAAEFRRLAKRSKDEAGKAQDLADVLAAIEKLPEPDRSLAAQVHHIVTTSAPQLNPRTWYGFPAYYLDGKLVTFFQYASKFKARYSTLGFADNANLDDGSMWPVAFAVINIDAATEEQIVDLVKRAI